MRAWGWAVVAVLGGCAASEGEPNDGETAAASADAASSGDAQGSMGPGSGASGMSGASTSGPSSDADAGSGSASPDPTTSGSATADGDSGDEAGSSTTGDPQVDTCLERIDSVVFDDTPPDGETRVPTLGACIDVVDGEGLWNYHCQWCHSTLDNNDINERTLERVNWAVDTSEALGNWPMGDLADNPDAVDRILDAIVASPPAVPDHPHPLPEYE